MGSAAAQPAGNQDAPAAVQLRQRLAQDAGLLAHLCGDDYAAKVLCNIARALAQPTGGRA